MFGESFDSTSKDVHRPQGHVSEEQWDRQSRAQTDRFLVESRVRVVGVDRFCQIVHMNRRPIDDRSTADSPTVRTWEEIWAPDRFIVQLIFKASIGEVHNAVPVNGVEAREIGLAKLLRPLGDYFEDRLRIRRRLGDDLQHVCHRRLALQGLLLLPEEPRVLDGDHGLVSEGAKQRFISIAESPLARVHRDQSADRSTIRDERNGAGRLAAKTDVSLTFGLGRSAKLRTLRTNRIRNRPLFADGYGNGGPGIDRDAYRLIGRVRVCIPDHNILGLHFADQCALDLQQPRCIFSHRTQHGVEIDSRLTDGLHDGGNGRLPLQGLFGLAVALL